MKVAMSLTAAAGFSGLVTFSVASEAHKNMRTPQKDRSGAIETELTIDVINQIQLEDQTFWSRSLSMFHEGYSSYACNSNLSPNLPPASETYSCAAQENVCGKSTDKYYELIASYEKYWIENYPAGLNAPPDAKGAYTILRTFTGGAGFNNGEKATDGPLGPMLTIIPGETMAILLRNNLQPGTPPTLISNGMQSVNKTAYMPFLDPENPENPYSFMQENGFSFIGPVPTTVDNVSIPNPENIPFDYDSVNLHLHGMIVQPHLFFPEGTMNSDASWISVGPGECYCYYFYIPEDHPTGTYWWHTHRHGSSAMWTWAQAAGLINVEGSFKEELVEQGIEDEMAFVVTDPHFRYSSEEDNTYVIATFLDSQTDNVANIEVPFHVNGMFQPSFEMKTGESTWMRFLCATTESLLNFRILDSEGNIVPVWDAGSDGINYEKPTRREQFVQAGGMRQDLVVQFDKPGMYEVWSKGLENLQFYGNGPPDQKVATFIVTGPQVASPVNVSSLAFTLPKATAADIPASAVTKRKTIYFDVGGDVTVIPFPQFTINQRAFNLSYIMFDGDFVLDGHAEEWTLVSTANATHPFHLHVLPFQVKLATTGNAAISDMEPYFTEVNPPDVWRDVVIIPPYGVVKVWVQFSTSPVVNLNGKSVFHCHFLAHEDTGMITAIKYYDLTEAAPNEP